MSSAAEALVASCNPVFIEKVDEANQVTKDSLDILQINVGLKCNLACRHCHVQAGPERTELMSKEVMQACLDVIDTYGFKTLDITGGSPEMNPNLEWLLREASKRSLTVMVRSNLTILTLPEYEHFASLYAELGVQIVASLPHYVQKNTDKQRGEGVYDASIEVLRYLCSLGYGKGNGRELNLVFNPGGAFFPPAQDQIEREYKKRLHEQYGIVFDKLFAITNNPLGRFAGALQSKDRLQPYMDKLIGAFNPTTLPGMMCRNQLSVDYQGICYDCDFNQAAHLPCKDARTIFDYRDGSLELKRRIVFGNHCYACCAGSGSSCGGETT